MEGIFGITAGAPKFARKLRRREEWSKRDLQVQIFSGLGAVTMVRIISLMAVVMFPVVAAQAVAPSDQVQAPGIYGGAAGMAGVMGSGDPCDRGTIFNALKVVRAYRDNEAFAYKHFEKKQLEISGRLVGVKRDKIMDGDKVKFEGFVALVTPDGKPPKPTGLEFRFPLAALEADKQLACDVAALWPGQFVTLRGTCIGAVPEGEYVGVIFNDAQIVH